MISYYRLFDPDPPAGGGCIPVAREDANDWNARHWGIFATVQEFEGERRKANLVRLRSWSVDIDDGTKEEQVARINRSPLIPSTVVETKRGYQVHYHAEDATLSTWDAIVFDRLIPFFAADKGVRDVARIMRVPGYLHQKDPADPFLVAVVHRAQVRYREADMLRAFTDANQAEKERRQRAKAEREARAAGAGTGDDFWEQVYALDCVVGLERLSGTAPVGGENLTLRRIRGGRHNIVVDGVQTSCWIDEGGRIGSKTNGGPTLYQWLRWYGNSPAECVRVLREIFPHLPARSP